MVDSKFNVILWDFDGVILNSNEIRDFGFKIVLDKYPASQVDKLMKFHNENGGLSRYVKFRYFFEEVRREKVTNSQINEWADKFSFIMKKKLVNQDLIINETVDFIKSNYSEINMHIVSGSDQNELRYICKELDISKFFKSIHGSPTPKNELVKHVLDKNNYIKGECVLVGDSINDYEAAKVNQICFKAYNNPKLKDIKSL